jgi:TRAP transporter TAXI family solute receptor
MHLVVRKAAGIHSVADLRDKRVSLDEQGSGTLEEARLLLDAWGVKEADIKAEHLKLEEATRRMKEGTLDAFFYVGGYPVPAIVDLANSTSIDLPPIDGPKAEKLRGDYKFLARDEIPANTYKDIDATKTLSVGALWITSAKVDAAMVYEATKGLWSEKTRAALEAGHPKGKLIRKETALTGVGIPLHPGAERFYREAGFLR